MKIAIMGSGGVGGYMGARLASDNDVSFIARGEHLKAIQKRGLLIESPLGNLHIHPYATDDPGQIGVVDLVLFTVKLWDTDLALKAIQPLVGPQTAILSFQNGITKDAALSALYGQERVIGGVCYISSYVDRPGVIKHMGGTPRFLFGELDGTESERVKTFRQVCLKADLDAQISLDIRKATWEKFVFLVGFSAITAATRQTIGPIRAHPKTRKLFLDLMQEVVDVGRASHVNLDPDYAEQQLQFADRLLSDIKASMCVDLERGNRLELDWLSGTVVQLGQKLGVETPCNRVIDAILAPWSSDRVPAAARDAR